MKLLATLIASDLDRRELEYLVLPYGEPGTTNLGRITASAGSVMIPSDPAALTLNFEHDYTQPVGRATSITEDATGIRARFKIAATTRGDDLLIEAAEGLRTGASVEIDNPVIRGGKLISGVLTAVAAVVKPAFPSAQLVAADCGDDVNPTIGGTMPQQQQASAATTVEPDVQVETIEAESSVETASAAPLAASAAEQPAAPSAALTAARAPLGVQSPQVKAVDRQHDLKTVSQMLASVAERSGGSTRMSSQLIAALAEVAAADVLDVATPESFEGKIWDGADYERQHVDLVETEALNALKYKGWSWDKDDLTGDDLKPTMAIYDGFPNEPPTNDVSAVETTWEPSLIAWAGQLDRKYRDFSEPGFWEAFFKAVATSYARVTDLDIVLSTLRSEATAIELDGSDKPENVPDGVYKLVKGIRAVAKYGMPTGARLHGDLWEEIMFTPQDQVLPYLQMALGVKDGHALNFTIKPDDEVLQEGEVLVVVKKAARFRELPGAPIRVDAEVISKGGLEQGVFGYAGVEVFAPHAIALVTTEEGSSDDGGGNDGPPEQV